MPTPSCNCLRYAYMRKRTACFLASILLAACGACAERKFSDVLSLKDESPLARFKTLLQTPPVIYRLVFAETLPSVPNKAAPLDIGIAGSTNHVFYELRWQPNGMFFGEMAGLSDLPNRIIGGRGFLLWKDHFYFLGGRQPMLYVLEDAKARGGEYSTVYHATLIQRSRACEPLNLGISHLTPGMIQWESNHFSVLTTADKKPMVVRGAITGFSNDIPCELSVQYSNNMGTANYRIAYDYEHYASPYYPCHITAFFRFQGKEVPYRAYTLISVRTAEKPLPESDYDLRSYFPANDQPLLYLTNESVYVKLPSGRLLESPSSVPRLKLTRDDYRKNRPYYVAAASVSLCFLALTIREEVRRKQR